VVSISRSPHSKLPSATSRWQHEIFFDNNLSPHLAHAIQDVCRVEKTVARVIHLRDRFAPDAKDHD
jgi:hypothetical protein